jgi:hypothetical protein
VRLKGLGDLVGIRTHDLAACSIVAYLNLVKLKKKKRYA